MPLISSSRSQPEGVSLFQHQELWPCLGLNFRGPPASGQNGIIDAKAMAKRRRYAILLIFVLRGGDPPDLISQILMALPLAPLRTEHHAGELFGRTQDATLRAESEGGGLRSPS